MFNSELVSPYIINLLLYMKLKFAFKLLKLIPYKVLIYISLGVLNSSKKNSKFGFPLSKNPPKIKYLLIVYFTILNLVNTILKKFISIFHFYF